MGPAPFLRRQRRALVLGALVIALHWLALEWLGAQMRTRVAAPDPERVTVLAQLLAPEPKPPAARPPPRRRAPVHPARRPPSVPPAPAPVPDAQPPVEPAEAAPSAPEDAGGALRGEGQASAEASPVQADSASASAAPEAPERIGYKVDPPPGADITLDVDRTDADGTHWTGEAELAWQLDGQRYRIDIQAGIRLLFTRVNLVVLTSEGSIDDSGFAPSTMTEKRRGRALTATHFNREEGTITFSSSPKAYPLDAGAQDKASVPLQLAAIARGDPGQLTGNIDIQVGEDRGASVYRFVVLGQEWIDTRLGRIETWHLSRPPKPGTYNARLDIWLAPGRGWYPVQIRNLEASGAVTTQTVNNIVMK
jgi:hypothetical protein